VLQLPSNAKINLGLKVLNKREDGYHNLFSLFLPISLCDSIQFELANTVTVKSTVDEFVPQELNLCYKAAMALQEYTGSKYGVHILCEKKIPMGAGLGGGSSNAATTLLGLRQLWELSISDEELHTIAMKLGSDVPFFLQNAPMIVSGKGDILTPFPISNFPYSMILVNPGIHSSTVSAFKKLGRTTTFQADIPDYSQFIVNNSFVIPETKSFIENDFEIVLFEEFPILEEIKTKFRNFGAKLSIMSGSGSTMVGLFSEPVNSEIVKNTYEQFKRQFPSTYIVHCLL
jgi:4-diphosphocytidyl-2-C-methyl-D-erythritol kinase